MNQGIVESSAGVTLLAGGPVAKRDLRRALALAPVLVAADGGADRAFALGADPVAAIGDMDSISDAAKARLGPRFHHIPEQESTDFDKALRNIAAPFVLGLGCLGGRVDHELATLSVLVRRADVPCLLVGREDVIFVAPPVLEMDLQVGDRFSLFPMAPVTGRSAGLEWPIDGLAFAPGVRGGTSNRVTGPVRLEMDAPGMLVIVPRARLVQALAARLASIPGWGGAL
ncbi:thiamine diphosphokinase [Pseudorhodobacter sp. E13]|uniref:thiamine diphosphokinase n=1 Tax=Pseudorhodobacter sp. E13 TaxID=2487931 RepID=UPI000F8F49F3|nr:thiamine diphosphokinase [Pseudorhodobacter sp. E13]RUS63273.1 thiamine diphosphokinase [Pseudorhodobacter sp. E13]